MDGLCPQVREAAFLKTDPVYALNFSIKVWGKKKVTTGLSSIGACNVAVATDTGVHKTQPIVSSRASEHEMNELPSGVTGVLSPHVRKVDCEHGPGL